MTYAECAAVCDLINATNRAEAYLCLAREGMEDADWGWYLKVIVGAISPHMLLHREFYVLDAGVAELLARTVDVGDNWQFWILYTPGTAIPEEMLHSIDAAEDNLERT